MIATEPRTPATVRTVIVSMAVAVGVAALTNGLLAAFGLNRAQTEHWPRFAPPGPAIGAIWVVLFAGMGAAYALARRKPEVGALIVLCLAYPFYTHMFRSHTTELAGNIVTFCYAVWLVAKVRSESMAAAALAGAVAVWIAFATALVVALGSANGWAN